MADDWQAGDLAQYIGGGAGDAGDVLGIPQIGFGPVVGLTYTVAAVLMARDCYGLQELGLKLAEIGPRFDGACAYNAIFFRKVSPRQADAEDAETIRLLNSAPVRESTQ